MVKKVIDVVSRASNQTSGNVAVRIVKPMKLQPVKPQASKQGKEPKKKRAKKGWKIPKLSFRFNLNWLFGGLAALLILLITGIVLSMKAKASITLYPALEDVSFQDEFEVLSSQEQLDLEKKIIPGKVFETTEEKWLNFQSTGSDQSGSKAEGVITIYNSQNPPRPFNFVSQTRFVSSESGKTFKAIEKIIVPAAVLSGGKIIPSSIDAKVRAQDPGEAYNIGPSKFSVPGLSGSAFYYNVWGESKTEMKGGSSSVVKIITADDIELAQEKLQKDLESQAKEGIARALPEGFTFDKDAVSFDSFEPSCFQKQGDQVAEFNCYGKLKASGLGFKREELDNLVDNFLRKSIGDNKDYSDESVVLKIFSKSALSKGGSVSLGFTAQVKVFEGISEQAFASRIKGENKSAISDIIKQEFPQVSKAQVKVWPFWMRKIPKDLSRIQIQLQKNQNN